MWTQLLDLYGNILMETMLRGVPSPGEWVEFDAWTSAEEPTERAQHRKAHVRWRVLSVKHVIALDRHLLTVVLAGDEG